MKNAGQKQSTPIRENTPKASFLTGLGSIFNPFGGYFPAVRASEPLASDWAKISSDWAIIGQDFWRTLDTFEGTASNNPFSSGKNNE
jgi:hypothetical protein